MALKRLVIDGYGQLELNQVTFTRTGSVEAQCGLANTFTKNAPCEVGMLLAVDKANKTIKLPSADETLPIALNYSTEKIYDQMNPGLKNFKMTYEDNAEYFFPRMGYLSVGDRYTTNCVCADIAATGADFVDEAAVHTALKAYKTTAIYAKPSTMGAAQIVKTMPTEGIVLQVVDYTTMPDGQFGIKFLVVKA